MCNIVYIGMEETGYACLEKLLNWKTNIRMVYTIVESMRNKIIAFKSFDSLRERFGVEIKKVMNINDPLIISEIKETRPDLIYVVSWSQLIHKDILNIPALGCIGFHASLLPKHKGRAPVPWTIIFGLKKSGVTMFYLSDKPDEGDIIGQEEFDINVGDDAYSIYKKVECCTLRLLIKYHSRLLEGTAPRTKQVPRDSDYWPKRIPADGYIDWNKSAQHIYDWVRALSHPFPGAFSYCDSRKLFIWKCRIFSSEPKFLSGHIHRDISTDELIVGCGEGAVVLETAQFEGKKRLTGTHMLKEFNEISYLE